MKRNQIYKLVLTALLAALTYVMTRVVQLPTVGGYTNLGDSMCLGSVDEVGNGMNRSESRFKSLCARRMQKRKTAKFQKTGVSSFLDDRGGKCGRGYCPSPIDLSATALELR